MEHREVVARRRMVRAFQRRPVPETTLTRLIDQARRAPSAGNSQGVEFLVLTGPEETGRYWDVTLPAPRRDGFAWPRLLDAPVLVLPMGDPARYVARYAEADKMATGLGGGADRWPTPYWTVDAAMATHGLLLGATDAGLGALLFGLFGHEAGVRAAFTIPDRMTLVGTVALGHPAPGRPGRSAGRPRRALDEVMHRGTVADRTV